jgi:hypothetical protein
MILKNTIKEVEKSKIFKDFMKENPEFYLVHCFTMLDEKEKKYEWQLGYYSLKKDKLVVFETVPEIKLLDQDDAFTRENIVKKLDMKLVKVSLGKALEICDNLVKEKYAAQTITKRIIILQTVEKQIYNITLITMSYSILNIKIDAASGEIISHNLQSILSLGKWEKGERGKEE